MAESVVYHCHSHTHCVVCCGLAAVLGWRKESDEEEEARGRIEMSFVCPECGYVEYNWRPKTWDTTCGDWLCRVSELEQFDPELAKKLHEKKEVVGSIYAYKISKTGVWVIRRWIQIFKIQGWKNIPAEKVIQNKLAQNVTQKKLLETEQELKLEARHCLWFGERYGGFNCCVACERAEECKEALLVKETQ